MFFVSIERVNGVNKQHVQYMQYCSTERTLNPYMRIISIIPWSVSILDSDPWPLKFFNAQLVVDYPLQICGHALSHTRQHKMFVITFTSFILYHFTAGCRVLAMRDTAYCWIHWRGFCLKNSEASSTFLKQFSWC